MKKTSVFILLIFHSLFITSYARMNVLANYNEAKADIKTQLNALLTDYYGMKDALVATDGKTVQQKANDFLLTLAKVDMAQMTQEQHDLYMQLVSKIKSETKAIANTQDAEQQRTHFNDLSNHLYTVLKTFKVNDSPVYQQYCPMKKAYWLSNNSAIKNPYYGKMMLTCGKVTETLN
ncbi:DUF3347 domain-containing protein [Runella sp. SP2]|uniref:DUF3347 domain-containing protein n=1 Tax=Runella sp. SP2 TaxID=2268026 RepID=UPI000F08F02C|nr:DUF3347 domain-containing protein [Runella sp. SP2]AYQ33095.1 DUF3347 domain-containing protein [Runella sp. SP2]